MKQSFILLALVLSGCQSWAWKPDPFVGDSMNERIVNAKAEFVQCKDPAFDTYTCFKPADIESLKFNIEMVKRHCKWR